MSIQKYLIRLRSKAQVSNFICPSCDHELSSLYIKDRFIWSKANDVLQVDILAKEGSLKTLEYNVSHSEAFETAMQDQ